MSVEARICEAPYHVAACSGKGESEDHFTPKCIGRLLGWTSEEINSPNNKQWLSFACHAIKDQTTSNRLKILTAQLTKDLDVNLSYVKQWSRRENKSIKAAGGVNENFIEALTLYIDKNGKENLTQEVVEELWLQAGNKRGSQHHLFV